MTGKDRRDLGFLITTSDAASQHFDRVLAEFTRLGYPFAVNFDHCCGDTKRLFRTHPLFLEGWYDDNPESLFDETHKQRPLDILVRHGFAWAAYLDTDETFDRRAPEEIPKIIKADADLVWCPLLDFWGDERHYRVDGPLGPLMDPDGGKAGVIDKQFRDKFFRLAAGDWRYTHADLHAPFLFRRKTGFPLHPRRLRWPLYVLHRGLINYDLIAFKAAQWRRVYEPKVGWTHGEFYRWLADPANVPQIMPFDYDTWDGK